MSRLKHRNIFMPIRYLIIIISFFVLFSCQKNERGLVVGKIRSASKLATTEFTIDKVVYGSKTKKLGWVIKLNEATFLAYSQAIIKAGIDLEQLDEKDIDIDLLTKKISIKLPHVQVLNFSYPAEKFRRDQYISENVFMNRIKLEDQEQFFRDAEIDIRNNLQYMGIKETTERNTRKWLEGMLKALGYQEIYITFEKGGDLIYTIKPN